MPRRSATGSLLPVGPSVLRWSPLNGRRYYILAENEYLRVSNLVQAAISRGDPENSNKWLAAQDRLTKQILTLGEELGLTPKARKARGLIAPRK